MRNSSCGNIRETHSKKVLFICSLNAPSVLKHKDDIEILIKENNIDLLPINEIKLDNRIKNDTVAIDGYTVKRFDRNRHGGGAALYIRETLDFELRDDIPKASMESICIEVKLKCSKSFFIVALYRPSKHETQTVIEIETLLNALDNENKEIILIGDINCDDLPIDEKSTMIRNLRGLYRVYQMKQLIKEPTRSTLTMYSDNN